MSKRRVNPSLPKVAAGQTQMFDALDTLPPNPDRVYTCRECGSRRVAGPVTATVDPRWAVVTCLECADRVIAQVSPRSQSEG